MAKTPSSGEQDIAKQKKDREDGHERIMGVYLRCTPASAFVGSTKTLLVREIESRQGPIAVGKQLNKAV